MATKKRSAHKKSTRSRARYADDMPSFRLVKDTIPFTSTKFTRQTFYWILVVGFIVVLQLWIVKLQTEVGNLTNSLTETQQSK